MSKFYRIYGAIFGNIGLLIRKRAVASASRHDQYRKVDIDVWQSWQIGPRGW